MRVERPADGGLRVKICGITAPEDAAAAEAAGADAVGMILHAPGSRRLIDLRRAEDVAKAVGPFTSVVGVFVDAPAAFVHEALDRLRLDALQFHGGEDAATLAAFRARAKVVKAVRFSAGVDVEALAALPADAILVDGPAPGSGEAFAWHEAEASLRALPRLVLAGGLRVETVAEAVRTLRPYAVDVASGVETDTPGRKDHAAIRRFVAAARSALRPPPG